MGAQDMPGDAEWAEPHGLQVVRAAVDALLSDTVRVAAMSPLDHLEWARTLPDSLCEFELPPALEEVDQSWGALGECEFAQKQRAAFSFWAHRKRVTAKQWAREFASLPEHSRSILGPDKNLIVFEVRCVSDSCVGSPPTTLFSRACAGDVSRGWRGRRRIGARPASWFRAGREGASHSWRAPCGRSGGLLLLAGAMACHRRGQPRDFRQSGQGPLRRRRCGAGFSRQSARGCCGERMRSWRPLGCRVRTGRAGSLDQTPGR